MSGPLFRPEQVPSTGLTARPATPAPPNARVEDYLDHACAPLVGIVPYKQRSELRAEWRAHIEALTEAYQELGSDPHQAVSQSLRQFGDPRRLGREWAREWTRGTTAREPQPVWPTTLLAFATFALAWMAGLGLTAGMLDRWTWGLVHLGRWTEHMIFMALPVGAGLLTGLLTRGRPALGTFYALSALILAAVCLSWLLQPPWSSHILATTRFVYLVWMPAGCAVAGLSGFLCDRWLDWRRTWALW